MVIKNSSMEELLSRIHQGKKLVCFGAGQVLRDVCDLFNDLSFYDSISEILDNKATHFTCDCGKMKVSNIKEFLSANSQLEDYVFLITTVYYPDVFEQLNQIKALHNTDCYIYILARQVTSPYDLPLINADSKQLIPKKIHYVWFGGKEMPKQNRKWMESWEKYCPDYDIIRHDESNYDITRNAYMKGAYESKLYAFASDYARLDIIYNEGGIYLDTDVELLKNIDFVLYDEAFIGVSVPGGTGNGLGFGSVKGFNIWREVLDSYDALYFKPDKPHIYANNNSTTTAAIEKHGFKHKNELQLINGLRVYPTDVFCPTDIYLNPTAYTEKTVAIHHFDASWFETPAMSERKNQIARCRQFWDTYCTHLNPKGLY
jgi:hypothetical protein